MEDRLIEVGIYKDEFNVISNVNLPLLNIYRSIGLRRHMISRQHFSCLRYIDDIPNIIENPDYVGKSKNDDNAIELVKKYDKNVLIGIKLSEDNGYLYVSTMYELQESKLNRRIYSGRIKEFDIDNL